MSTTPDTEVKPTEDRTAALLATAISYLREEADFNRSWADGRRKVDFGPGSDSEGYKAHRLELAAVREAWADAIECVRNAYEPMREALNALRVDRDYWNADVRRLSAGLLAIHRADESVPASVLRGIAYDISLNCIPQDVAEFQIEERSRAALSTLPVNDRHNSGSDSYQADASAPALSEKVNVRAEWLPIESAPHGPNLILAFRNDAGKWRRVIGWHAKQFEIEVDADELHSGLEEGPAGEAIYAKSGWYEYLDADEAPCNRIWPSHWMPLPSPPDAELTISNDAERDGVCLKPDTSSQPASEAGKLSTDTDAAN